MGSSWHWYSNYKTKTVRGHTQSNCCFIAEKPIENLLRAGEFVPEKEVAEKGNKYSQLMRLKSVHFLTLFLVLYVGAEVTIGGRLNFSLDISIPERLHGDRLDRVNYGLRTGRWCIGGIYSIGILWRLVLASVYSVPFGRSDYLLKVCLLAASPCSKSIRW